MIGLTISRYKIVEKLGHGGMGVVYKAEDTQLRRTVALKFLSDSAVANEEDRARFLREAQAAAALDHPNICAVHGIEEAEGKVFLVMAYVDGPSVNRKIESGPLPLEEAVDIAIQIGQGLQEAHEKGVVHRDVKSANILMTAKGVAKITDFGLALLAGRSKLTKTGTTLGTVACMSPEQALAEQVDRRTDIWSLGVVLYEMAAGSLPFQGEYEQEIVYSILNEDPEPLTALRPEAPKELDRIVFKALAKGPEERYQHVDDMLVDLRLMKKNLGSNVPKSEAVVAGFAPAPAGQMLEGHRWIRPARIAAAIVLLVLSALAAWWLAQSP